MNDRFPYCYPPEGNVQVIGDGPELFVYSGLNDAPMWKHFGDGYFVGVHASRDRVFAVDHEGNLTGHRIVDGTKLEEQKIGDAGPHGMVGTSTGRLAVVCKDVVVVCDGKKELCVIKVRGATCASFGRDHGTIAIGDAAGTVTVYDSLTGKSQGSTSLGSAVTGLGWRVQGQWVAAAGRKVSQLSMDGSSVAKATDVGVPIGTITVSTDGALVACVSGMDIVLLGLAFDKTIGTISYQRTVRNVSFGREAWLGVGLEDADANRIDLSTGQMCKTEAHPGRTANRWGFKVDVDPMSVRQTVTHVRAGGSPIAKFIPPPSPDEDSSTTTSGCLKWFAGACCIGLVVLACSGVLGGIGFWYYNQ